VGSEPEVLEWFDYDIDKLDFIRQALAGYAGGSAIISEMLQNADDAGAQRASFHFRPKDFLAWNNAVFKDQDWKNITQIASGIKRNEAGKIGTWGTGFLSVFHLTDTPEVHSEGKKLVLDPRKHRIPAVPSEIRQGTAFRMPWRSQSTDISQSIEADIWDDQAIQSLKDDVAVAIYRLLLFLRNIKSIEIYEGELGKGKLLYKVERTLQSSFQREGYVCETWNYEYQRAGVQSRLDTWLYYRGNVPPHLMVDGTKPKDTEIGIAFPFENRDWLVKNLPGALYNFLPTPIQTGYNFQINGAFFPDNNRRTILVDPQTQREKSLWNHHVIGAIGDLFVQIFSDIRERVLEPRRFYEILPTQPPPADFLKAIYDAFCEAAPKEKIVFSSLGIWSEPGKVAIGRPGSRLPKLVADYLAIVPSDEVPQTFRDFLTDTLKIHKLDWKDAVNLLKEVVEPGIVLSDAHPMVNSVEKLWLLYSELTSTSTDDQRSFADVAICLGADGKLRPFSADIWRASEGTRSLCSNSGLLFVSLEVQKQFSRLLENLVPELRGSEFVEWLSRQPWSDGPISLANIPALLESLDHVAELIEFFYTDLQRINRDLLKKLPIIYSEDGCLYTAEARVFFHRDAAERSDLQPFGLQFVHQNWAIQEKIRVIYERAGIEDLTPRNLIQALREHPLNSHDLPHAELVEKLLKIYGYLNRNRGALDDVNKNNLLSMSLCLTQCNRLTSVQEEQNGLHLPGDERITQSPALGSLDKLQLDHLIHSDVLAGRDFLTQVLGLRPLSKVDLIRNVILKHYHDIRLDEADRQNLLNYVSEQMRSLPNYQQNELWPELRTANLILCSNGEYHAAEQVYFASPAIDTVFGTGYLKLHSDYKVSVPEPDDNDQAPYRQSIWYWLFENLRTNESPAAPDLVKAIEQLTKINPPTEAKVEAVRRLYDFLNSEISENKTYFSNPEIQRLSGIAWLPARNRNDRWYFPREIYQASLVYLIGEQAPLLLFRESREQLRSVLGMPRYPDVEIVAKHLLNLAQRKKPLEENDLRIYQDLGNRWYDLSSSLQQNLKTADVVWSSSRKRYWRPGHVFLANFGHLFGDRRSYMQSPGGDAQKFLSYLGVRDEPHSYNDSLDLLSEIAQDYTDGTPISDDDYKLVYANLFHLSQFENYHIHDRLKKMRFMPAANRLLYEPSQIALVDRKDLLLWFEEIDFPRLDQEKLTEPVYKLLRKSGMPLLSELIRRELIDIDGKQLDTILNNQIPHLKEAFQRVALGAYQGDEEAEKRAFQAIDLLVNLEIFSCDRIVVQYSLQNQNGWHTLGHQNTEEKSLLDKATNSLYVHRVNKRLDNVQLALEIENLLFPGSKVSIVIENLLEKKLAEINNFLDRHGYPIVLGESSISPMPSPTQGELDKWEIPSAVSGEDEKGTNAGSLIGADVVNTPVSPHSPDLNTEPEKPSAEGCQAEPNTVGQPSTEKPPSESVETKDQPDASIPAFTGNTHPTVPVLPNDYADLQRRYGLTLHPSELEDDEDDILNSDRKWIDDKDAEKEGGTVTSTRFTLTFSNRYEGFLPLHQSAKQMLWDRPAHLICETDFAQWEFDLYVDYNLQIIYNQADLPDFFTAHNIPAGGIIYLERVHGNNCRIFWKNAQSQVKNVSCLELLEDGTLEEYEISSAEFPCELSEFVFRSEKRLEDIEALFQQAIGKRGVFQTICDVFGESGRDLSFEEIFHEVIKIRMVAKASIDYQLNQQPCFVKIKDGRWRFDPDRGVKFDHKKGDPARPRSTEIQATVTIQPDEHKKPVTPTSIEAPSPSAASILLREIRKEWVLLSEFFKADDEKQPDELRNVIVQMIKLANRWQASLQALVSQESLDEPLAGFWQHIVQYPQDQKAAQLFEKRLRELLDTDTIENVIAQLDHLLAGTPIESRQIFHKLLSVEASNAFEQERFDQALSIYQLLEKEDAGNFKDKLERISQNKIVQIRLQELDQENSRKDRMILLQLAWEECPGFPSLRRAIQIEVKASASQQIEIIQAHFDSGQFNSAYQTYIEWAELVWPLAEGWKSDPSLSAQVWEISRTVFIRLVTEGCKSEHKECFCQALHVANDLPLDIQRHIPSPEYADVLIEVANGFGQREEIPEAAALIEFGLYLISESNRSLEKYLEYRINEYAGRLFEQLESLSRADSYYSKAIKCASKEQVQRLSHRRNSLLERRKNYSDDTENLETNEWIAILESLFVKKDFMAFVDEELFKDFVSGLSQDL